MSLEIKRLEVQIANIKAARMNNELKVEEMRESIQRLNKDIELSTQKEKEIEEQIKQKRGN